MATVTAAIKLQDGMTSTLSDIQKQSLKNIQTFNNLSKEIDDIQKMMAEAEQRNPDIIGSDNWAMANASIDEMEKKLQEFKNGEVEVEDENDKMQKSMTEVNQALELLSKAWSTLTSVMQDANEWMEMSNNQFNSEFATLIKMHNILGASQEEIDSMYKYASALQEVGVVGDEATLAGAAQLSKFVSNTDQLKTLIPLVDDLAVSENGLNTSQGNVESAATMVGKALQGSATMLKRQGILTDAQADKLDSLNSVTEKVNLLQKYLQQSVGGTNEMLATTAQGGIMQAENSLGDLKEELGTAVIPYFEMFQKILVDILTPITDFVTANSSWLIPCLLAVIGAVGAMIAILTIYNIVGAITAGVNWAIVAPLLIIVAMVALFVVALNIAAQVLSAVTGQSVSALGLVAGAFSTLYAIAYNVALGLYDIFAGTINAIATVFQDVISTIELLFIGLAQIVIGIVNTIAKAIDAVFGSNLSESTQGLLDKLDAKGQEVLETGYQDKEVLGYNTDFKNLSEAYQSGYNWGDNAFNGINSDGASTFDLNQMYDSLNNLNGTVGNDSTGTSAVKTTTNDDLLSDDDIQLLLDVATRDYQLNYQQVTPNVTVSFGDVRETANVDDVMNAVAVGIEELINGDAEVVL